jgi:signal transduction histidine kinase
VTELVRQARAAGVSVTYRLTGEGTDVDARLAEVSSRIVTEALTNALKHAPGAPVAVAVHAAGGALELTVENGAGPGIPNGLGRTGGGYGLAGMRDRVAAAGGRLSAGPAEGGGWRVHASLQAQTDSVHGEPTPPG